VKTHMPLTMYSTRRQRWIQRVSSPARLPRRQTGVTAVRQAPAEEKGEKGAGRERGGLPSECVGAAITAEDAARLAVGPAGAAEERAARAAVVLVVVAEERGERGRGEEDGQADQRDGDLCRSGAAVHIVNVD
jgi:hypothetical protein